MKFSINVYCTLIASVIFLTGCEKTIPAEDFARWFEDKNNGFVFEQSIDSFSYHVQYRPGDLMSLIAYNGDPNQNISTLKKEFSDDWYFKLNICEIDKKKDALKTNLQSESDYFNRIHFLSEDIKTNTFLILNTNDTVWCALHSYERTYNINPCQTILFSFPKMADVSISKMVLFDEVFSGKPVEFVMPDIDKKEFPKYKL